MEDREGIQSVSRRELWRAIILFVLTLISVFFVYGYQWTEGDPLSDLETAQASFLFSITLLSILLAHEMGHYCVARAHGFSLSLPVFLPFPFAFGTMGAVIQLRSLPKNRSALLEMGAAGPIAGFICAIAALLYGLPKTDNQKKVQLPESMRDELLNAPPVEEGFFDFMVPEQGPSEVLIMLMEDPLLLRGLGNLMLGEPLSPYAILHPVAFAGWVGALLTAVNMIPVGQLDGGHILNALYPKNALKWSKVVLGCLFCMGVVFWPGWAMWAFLITAMGAYRPIFIERLDALSIRALFVAGCAYVAFGLCFMLRPIGLVAISFEDIEWVGGVEEEYLDKEGTGK